MARSSNQKLKLLYLRQYLLEQTDENHPVSIKDILKYLASKDIRAERKSIYSDLEQLDSFGLEIDQRREGKRNHYYVYEREFELPEVKLMVDCILSSKFITSKKSRELIDKLKKLVSVHQAQRLSREVFVENRVKSMNESIYINVDAIHTSINENKKIKFQYFQYNVNKEFCPRHGADYYYVISPFALLYNNENYYMIGYDSAAKKLKHFRVDKMKSISNTDEPREGQQDFDQIDMAIYSKKIFGMFSGYEAQVQLRFDNSLVGVVIDRFGVDASIVKEDDEHFTVSVNVLISPQFFAWLCGFGKSVKILSPAKVAEDFKAHIRTALEQYETE